MSQKRKQKTDKRKKRSPKQKARRRAARREAPAQAPQVVHPHVDLAWLERQLEQATVVPNEIRFTTARGYMDFTGRRLK